MSLWLPPGTRPRARVDLRPEEMALLRALHRLAQREGWRLSCVRCDAALTGRNLPSDREHAVACRCREWVAPVSVREP
jgi:hypothetical protein